MKTPPAPEGIDGVFHAFTSGKVAALGLKTSPEPVRSRRVGIFCSRFPDSRQQPPKPTQNLGVVSSDQVEEAYMRKTLAILATVATVGATAISAPAQARGLGPGLAFGLAAGAIAAGVAGAYGPYYGPGYGYYGPRYGYYGPRYYGPAYYGPGHYAYYGGPYYRHHRHWRHHW
jgi:hypothetical protein